VLQSEGGRGWRFEAKMAMPKWRNVRESGKQSPEHDWSKKYVNGLLAGFPGGTLFSAEVMQKKS